MNILIFAVCAVFAAPSSPQVYWIGAEDSFTQVGSRAAGVTIQRATEGRGLGAGWGGGKGNRVVYRFGIERPMENVVLWIRYAQKMGKPTRYTLVFDEKQFDREVVFPHTDGWGHLRDDEWRYVSVPVGDLEQGWHSFSLISKADENNTNLDGIFIVEGAFTPPDSRDKIEKFPKASVSRGRQRPKSEARCIDKNLSFEDVEGTRHDRYYPKEESRERASLVVPEVVAVEPGAAVLVIDAKSHRVEVGGTLGGWLLAETLDGPEPLAVLERSFDHWGLFVYVGENGPIAEVRKPIGRLENIRDLEVQFPPDYFKRLVDSQEDVLGKRVLDRHGEASFENVLGFLAPLEAYTFLGSPESTVKYDVQPDGTIGHLPRQWGGNKSLADVILDPRELSPEYAEVPAIGEIESPDDLPIQSKRGLLGGYLPAIDFGYHDLKKEYGFGWSALMEPGGSATVFTRFRDTKGHLFYHQLAPVARLDNGKRYFAALLELHRQWEAFFTEGMQFEVSDPRVRDVIRASIARALSGYVDLHPKYGMGGYWGTNDLHDGFPPTTLTLGTTLLAWGFPDEAKKYLGYYLDRFVKPDGTLKYYGPAIAEYGELIDLAVMCARQSRDAEWFDRHRPALERMAAYLVELRRTSVEKQTPDQTTYGMIFGGAEADAYNKPDYFFSGNAWCWRALTELGRYYVELGHARGDSAMVEKGKSWLGEAESLQKDIHRAVRGSIIQVEDATFVPPIAGFKRPFQRMTEDWDANYTNYRYWPELLYAGCLPRELERAILDYRASRGGDLLAMTRFAKGVQHLDNWPYYQHAYGLLADDRVSQLILGYFAHMAHHQTAGTFTSYEQVDLFGFCRRHDYADYCVPAQLTIPLLSRWMLAFEERDEETLWLLRATPRAWLSDRLAFSNALTRWGPIDLSVEPDESLDRYVVRISFAEKYPRELRLRLRHPEKRSIGDVDIQGGECVRLVADSEYIVIRPTGQVVDIVLRFAK